MCAFHLIEIIIFNQPTHSIEMGKNWERYCNLCNQLQLLLVFNVDWIIEFNSEWWEAKCRVVFSNLMRMIYIRSFDIANFQFQHLFGWVWGKHLLFCWKMNLTIGRDSHVAVTSKHASWNAGSVRLHWRHSRYNACNRLSKPLIS